MLLEGLLVLLALFFVLAPIVALVIAISANNETKRLKVELERLSSKLKDLQGGALQGQSEAAFMPPKPEADAALQGGLAEAEPMPEAKDEEKVPKEAAGQQAALQQAAGQQATARASVASVVSGEGRDDAGAKAATAPRENYVFNAANKSRFVSFIQNYWLYILGALTLALSGVYLVRWGIENGFFPPILRVLSAYLLGGGLIYGAERLRARFGDEKGSSLEYLPSSVAAAGLSVLYAASFGAHQLYGLIGSSTSFVLMFGIALFAIAMGLRFGLLLSALGVMGAYVVPFMVGGGGGREYFLFAYSILIMAVAMVVDSFRRSAWLSVFAMALSMAFSLYIYLQASAILEFNLGFVLYGAAFLVAGATIPMRRLVPDWGGVDLLQIFTGGAKARPEFPTILAGQGMLGAVLVALFCFGQSWQVFFWFHIWYFFIVSMLAFYWLGQCSALQDLPLLPVLAFLVVFMMVAPVVLLDGAQGSAAVSEVMILERRLWVVTLMGLIIGLSSAIATFTFERHQSIYGFAAVAYPLFISIVFELNWPNYGAQSGALLPMRVLLLAYALLIVAIYWRKLGQKSILTELAVMGAFLGVSLMALRELDIDGFVYLIFAQLALAIWLSFRFEWIWVKRLGQIYTILVALFISGELVFAFFNMRVQESILRFVIDDLGHALLLLFGFYAMMRFALQKDDPKLSHLFEGYLLAFVPMAIIVVATYLAASLGIDEEYIRVSWLALMLGFMALGMKKRMEAGGLTAKFRMVFLWIYLGLALILAFVAMFILNPIWMNGDHIQGWPIFNSLLFAYAPILLMIYYVWRFVKFPRKENLPIKWVLIALGVGLGLELVRQFWQGANIYIGRSNPMGETVSYTVILLAAIAMAMYFSLRDHSKFWRNAAIALLIATALKVYFIDLTHTAGIARVLVLFVFGAVLLAFNFVDQKGMKARSQIDKNPKS